MFIHCAAAITACGTLVRPGYYMGTMSHNSSCHGAVVVVEDDLLVRWDAVAILREAGFEVIEAEDASHALEVVEARDDIVLVFTDINMPGDLDGLALAWRVRATQPTIHVLLTSGEVRPKPEELPDGAFLPKPYSAAAVTQAVDELLAA